MIFAIETITATLAYIVFALGIAFTKIEYIRTALIVGSILQILTGYLIHFEAMMIWNSIFFTINLIKFIQLLYMKSKISLPKELRDIYEQVFSFSLLPREFYKIYKKATFVEFDTNEIILYDGKKTNTIYLLLKGNAAIAKDQIQINIIKPYTFIGEMQYFTRGAAHADVIALNKVQCLSFSHKYLAKDHALSEKFNHALSLDLINKIKLYNLKLVKSLN